MRNNVTSYPLQDTGLKCSGVILAVLVHQPLMETCCTRKLTKLLPPKLLWVLENVWRTWSIFIGFLSVELFLDVNIQANRMLRTRKCGYAENDSVGASSEPRLFVLVV